MKLSILKDELQAGLNAITRITSKSITLPILNNILIVCEKNFLKLASTDLEIGIKYWILAKTEKEGAITVPAKFFANLINLIPDQKIDLEEKNNILYIETKNYKSQIKGISADDFPIIPQIKSNKILEIKAKTLSEGLSQIIDTASPSQTRPEISGISFSVSKNIVEMAATDSFRLAEKKIILAKESSIPETSVILLQKAAREIINIFGEDAKRIKIYFSPNQVMFESEMNEVKHPHIQLISRLIEGEYPNYKEIIPSSFKTQIVLSRQDFLNQIKTASLFSGKINEIKIKVNPEQEIVEVHAQNPDLGQNKSRIKAKVKGQKAEVCFNHRFLTAGLSNIKTKEVIFGLNGEEDPAVLKPLDDESFIYVVMPIKSS